MNLGEIKIQAITLMYPDTVIKYDDSTDEGVENAVYELKCNHNFEGLLESCVGAINRAFSIIEARGLSTTKCADKALSLCKINNGRVEIQPQKDFFSLERLLCHRGGKTYACGYEISDGKIYTEEKGEIYTLVYATKIPRATRSTKESLELDLPGGVCEAIPYFVASELLAREDEERAKGAREQFEKMLSMCKRAASPCHQCFQIIYSME